MVEARARCGSSQEGGRLLLWFTGATVLSAMVLGGATWRTSEMDVVAQLMSLPLLGYAIWRLPRSRLSFMAWAGIFLAGSVFALPLLQLIHLPPEILRDLPGRHIIYRSFDAAGVEPGWMPLSLEPAATYAMALAVIPALAVFLSTLQLGIRARRRLCVVVVGCALVSVLIALLQVQLGQRESISLYATGSTAVGLFANRNHLAALLYAALPIVAACGIGWLADKRQIGRVGAVLFMLIFACLLLGIAMTRSRAGLALAGLGCAASMALAWRSSGTRYGMAHSRLLVLVGSALGTGLILNFALLGLVERLEVDISDDYRFVIARHTATAVVDFFPAGAGFGAFTPIYQMYEPASELLTVYANNAHNDWLELVLEGGAPAAVLVGAAVLWWAAGVRRCWCQLPGDRSALDAALPCAATVVIGLLFLHSIVDYPLRTTALQVVFALAAAILVDPADICVEEAVAKPQSRRRRRVEPADQAPTVSSAQSQPGSRRQREAWRGAAALAPKVASTETAQET